ncbi:MAG TPA: rhodanese-like domain-containing protein [Methylomirabilota bacterium]
MVSPRQVDREEVRRLAATGAQIVDVLPPGAYRQLHIAGATNLPLGRLDREAAETLAREALDADPASVVERVMDPGPPTIRPSVPLADTTPDGILLGVVDRADVANRSEAQPADTARGMA